MRGLTPDFFRKVSDTEVYGVGSLVAKHSKLGLVRRDDEGNNRATGLFSVNLLLRGVQLVSISSRLPPKRAMC